MKWNGWGADGAERHRRDERGEKDILDANGAARSPSTIGG